MSSLSNATNSRIFYYFEQICAIPHGSGNCKDISDYLMNFASQHNLEAYQDDFYNILIKKPASKGYENKEPIILQGHMDMVCEKEYDLDFDFEKDSIKTIIDGDWITAKGTTLGGDDGIAIALILSLLEDNSLAHPMIEAVITTEEETGMDGAFGFDLSKLKGKRLINLDSEEEGVICCSCAGGVRFTGSIPTIKSPHLGTLYKIEVNGLCSGHSGVDINKGRANAIVLMGRLLKSIEDSYPINLVSLSGGGKDNAIPGKCVVEFLTNSNNDITEKFNQIKNALLIEYKTTEPNMNINLEKKSEQDILALDSKTTARILDIILNIPNGVIAMNPDMTNFVQTSTNLGIINLFDDRLEFSSALRSSLSSQKEWLIQEHVGIINLAGGTYELHGDYPGWNYNPHSDLQKQLIKAFEETTKKTPRIESIHAGLECGIFASKGNLDCVSIGPDMEGVHTTNERLSISSSERLFVVLKHFLEIS